MEASQVLNEMAIAARQLILQEAMKEMIIFFEKDNYHYSDLLEVLSIYTKVKGQKDIERNPNWAVVSQFLESASTKISQGVDLGESDKTAKDIMPLELIAVRGFSKYFRQTFLLYIVSCWTEAIQTEKFRLSDLLNSLGNIAEERAKGEMDTSEDTELWRIVASFVKAAANAAEQEGQELT